MLDVLVIGAGLSGLVAAYTLHRAGYTVQVIESSDAVGGLIRSQQASGFLYEAGPHTFPSTATELLMLCEQLGLQPCTTHEQAKKRYLYLNRQLMALPMQPWEAINTPVLSWKGKLRLLGEPFQPKMPAEDVSVADFLTRRLGDEVVQHLADPFMSGVYAGDVSALSFPAIFPKLWAWEQSSGSLFRGAWQAKKQQAKLKQPRMPLHLLSFEQCLEVLPRALAQALPEGAIQLGQRVLSIQATAEGYQLTVQSAGEGALMAYQAKGVVVATPAGPAASLLSQVASSASALLSKIQYQGLAVVHVGLAQNQIPHGLDGFGVLIPRREGLPLLGAIWASSLFPVRAPQGQVLLSCFIGGAHAPEWITESPWRIEQQVLTDLQTIFKMPLLSKPEWTQVLCYEQAIPQYRLGHVALIQALGESLRQTPMLQVCGNYLHGVALNECVKSGEHAANQLIKMLK